MPRSETLPLIVKSLSRYNTPISLTIHKPIRIPLRDFIEQVAKLSNLTSLTFPYFSDFEYDPSQCDQPEWHLLTNLTRLREVTLLKPVRLQLRDRSKNAPRVQLSATEGFLRALVQLPHLTTLHFTNCYNYTSEEFFMYVPLLTRLEDLSIPMVTRATDLPPLDLFPSMSSHLTRLCLPLSPSMYSEDVNEFNAFHNLQVLQLLGLHIQHLSLTEISSLVTLEVSASRVTGLDNNTKLRHLRIIAHDDTFYDQIRKLPNLEWLALYMDDKNTDPYFFNEFSKLTYLRVCLQHNYEIWNISSSVKTLELEIRRLDDFNYASLALLTSLDSLIMTTYDRGTQTDGRNYLAEISTLTGLTRLTVETNGYDDLTLANLSTLTNLERFHTQNGSRLSLELSFLSHLTKLRAFSNCNLQEEHCWEIATLPQLTYLACLNKYNERGDFSLLSHLPLKILATEVLQDDLDSFLQAVSTMTTLELLGIFEEVHHYDVDTVKHADWSLLSSLTRLTRLDLDLSGTTSDTLTSLTRVTSLQYLYVMRPEHEVMDEDYQEDHNVEPTSSLDDWLPFTTQFPNLVSVSYVYSSVYTDPFTLEDFDKYSSP